MFEFIQSNLSEVLTYSVCGLSVGSILTFVGVLISFYKKVKVNSVVTKKQIEEAFNEAVLPTEIKFDVTNNVKTAVKEVLLETTDEIIARLDTIEKNQVLMLKIMSEFSHVKKLPEEVQEAIKEVTTKNEKIVKTVEV